ncbi:MAG: hypothetical protein ISS57_10785 [Anaerolineales bacterium]|nr:hypothetical protein [Chloroflexota bacterium]MBL7163083.1 hypothetical protein [Anaerolineales bacterium]
MNQPQVPDTESDLDALTAFVIKELSSFEEIDDIVVEICTRAGWDWQRGEEFVLDVQSEHHRLLTRRRNRLLVPMGLVIFLCGAALTYYTGDILWRDINSIFGRYVSNETIITALIDIFINNGYWFLIGLGMLVGGAYGLGKVLAT